MRCPYFLCRVEVQLDHDVDDEWVTDHLYDNFIRCPGSGYVVDPVVRDGEERRMTARAVAARLPRGTRA